MPAGEEVMEIRILHRQGKSIRSIATELSVSCETVLDFVWGRDVYVETRTVDVHVGRHRKALNRRGACDPTRTVREAGYALDETYSS